MDRNRLVGIGTEKVTNVSSTDFPGHHHGQNHEWNFESFQNALTVKVMRKSSLSIEFDLIGVDASIANAFRRIMIAEVPTVCIENVYIWDNTSVIDDEILAQRLGLIPLSVHPRTMKMQKPPPDDQPTDQDTMVFMLEVLCERKPDAPKDSTNPDDLYINHELLTSQLTWEPVGSQKDAYPAKESQPRSLNPNIVLAKLRPGQGVKIQMHAVKGFGKDHAKFSPVATATYRLLPRIDIKKPIPPQHAEKFQKCFSPGVINVDPQTKEASVDEENVRGDTVSREVLRHPEFKGHVELSRIRDHFLFSVESESAYKPEEIFLESVDILRAKIDVLQKAVLNLQNVHATPQDVDVTMSDT